MQQECSIEKAWARKYPEQVVLVLTKNAQGRVNAMAVGWVTLVSDEPPMSLLGIDHGAYTLELIRENREFVIAYPSRSMAEETLYFGTVHGHAIDKMEKSALALTPGKKGSVPLLADAVANFECRFVTEYCPGNCPLVVGEVLCAHENCDEKVLRLVNWAKGYDLH